jgi:hypothetical protein
MIYRRVKHNGVLGDPQLIVQIYTRTTQQYTDYDYSITSGYTDDLLYYDVRVEFSNGEQSDPDYAAFAYGEILARTKNSRKKVESLSILPSEFGIGAYPNPFNPTTSISVNLPRDSRVKVDVFGIHGQLITTLIDGFMTAGTHQTSWDSNTPGQTVSSGTYLVRMEATPDDGPPVVISRRIILLK